MDKPRKIRISNDVREKRGYGKDYPLKDQYQGRSNSFLIGSVPHHQMLAYANADQTYRMLHAKTFGTPMRYIPENADASHVNKTARKMRPVNVKEVKGNRNPSAVNPNAQ